MVWWIAAWAAPAVETEAAQPDTAVEEPAEAPVEDPGPYVIPSLGAELPSALQTGQLEAGEDDGSLKAALAQYGMDEGDFDKPALIRGGWFLRPRVAIAQLFGASRGPVALRLGFAAGRRFWTIQALPIQLAADVGLRGTVPIGGATGRRVEGFANVGPWLGPARIQLGLGARWERERWHGKTAELMDAIHLGPMLQLAFDLDFLQANVGFHPTWKLWGDRPRAAVADPLLPQIANETTWSAGLAAPIGIFRLGGDVAWRDTAVGGLFEVGLMLGLDLTAIRRAARRKKPEPDASDGAEAPAPTEEVP